MTGARHWTLFHLCGRCGIFCRLLKRWQAWVKLRGGFGGHLSLQKKCLVNLDAGWRGSRILFCETVLDHDDDDDDDDDV